MKKRYVAAIAAVLFLVPLLAVVVYYAVRTGYPRPYFSIVAESGQEWALVYSVMKAESGFSEDAVSEAGAVGLMQLLPSTAQFICEKEHIEYRAEELKEGAYNVLLGCKYLKYLRGRFHCTGTALAAYNAGEGTVSRWLCDPDCSSDGVTLQRIPFPETRGYLEKIAKFRKIYEFFYG